MGQHLIAWSQSITSTAMAARNAVPDPSVRVSGVDILIPPIFSKLCMAYGQGVNLAQAQFQSPTLRRRYPLDVSPIDIAATPTGPFAPLMDLTSRPIDLDVGEQLEAFLADTAAGANIVRALAWLTDGDFSLPAGPIFTFRTTASATLVAETWTNASLTLSNLLPYGTYAVVGFRAASATLIAARLVFPGPIFARPGVIGTTTASQLDDRRFRFGAFGNLGQFVSIAPPTVDFLATAGDTSEVVHLDLVKVA